MKLLIGFLSLFLMLPSAWSQDQADPQFKVAQFAKKGRLGGSIGLGFLSGNAGAFHQAEPGAIGHLTINYHPWNYHSLGIGVGSRLPALLSELIHMPVFIQYKAWVSQKPFVKMGFNAGYGFAFKDVENNVYDAKGGLTVNPFVGIKVNESKYWAWTLDIGLLYQKLYYRFGDIDIFESQEELDWKLWRFVFTTTFEI